MAAGVRLGTTVGERCDGALSGVIPHTPSIWGIAGTARPRKKETKERDPKRDQVGGMPAPFEAQRQPRQGA